MSRSTLSRSLMALAIASSVSSAYAATQTASVTGALAGWKTWNASSKSPIPVEMSKVGIDLVQGIAPGAATTTQSGGANSAYLNIPVTGSVSYDDADCDINNSNLCTITALTLNQTGSFTGYYDVDADFAMDDSYANSGAGGAVTYSGLSWALSGTNLGQVTGSATGCDAVVPQCQFTEDGVNANDNSNGLLQSVFDFQGINSGFQTLPKITVSGTIYGTNAKTWSAFPGVDGLTINISTGAITLAVASRVNSGVVTTNAANTATVTLTAALSNPANACTAGQYWNGSSCVNATAGHYALGSGALAEVACAAGTYQPSTGQASCLPAAVGKYVASTGATAQTDCLAGSYQPNTSATSCVDAAAGNVVASSAATAQQACTPGNYQPNPGQTSCIQSPANSYVSTSSAITSTACPVGSTSPAGSDDVSDCVRTPLNCSAGSYDSGLGLSCTDAPLGSYVPSPNATSATLCAAGTYQDLTGQTFCKSAPIGKYVSVTGAQVATACPVGFYQDETEKTSCKQATAGNFVASTGSASQSPCPSGYTSAAGAMACTRIPLSNCLAGEYDDGVTSSCVTAPAGSFVGNSNATSATACAAGTYQPNTGSTACLPADSGSFVSLTGSTAQSLCAAGTYQPDIEAAACIPAAAGSFVASAGATAQTPCVDGYTSNAGASICFVDQKTVLDNAITAIQDSLNPKKDQLITLLAGKQSSLTKYEGYKSSAAAQTIIANNAALAKKVRDKAKAKAKDLLKKAKALAKAKKLPAAAIALSQEVAADQASLASKQAELNALN